MIVLLNIKLISSLTIDDEIVLDYIDDVETAKQILNSQIVVSCEGGCRLFNAINKCNKYTNSGYKMSLYTIAILLSSVIKNLNNNTKIDNKKIEPVQLNEAEYKKWQNDFANEGNSITSDEVIAHNKAKENHIQIKADISYSEAENALFEMDANNVNEIIISEMFGSTSYTRKQCLSVMYN